MSGHQRQHSDHVACVDLSFGDTGKGSIVDWLCSDEGGGAVGVVRFNGGGQAGHNVSTRDGKHHTFSQFGSGTFHVGVRTFLSRYMLVDPLTLLAEAAHLEELGVGDCVDRLAVDRDALVVTPYHVAANRLRESRRGDGRHGSCGMGIGETAKGALDDGEGAVRVGDLFGTGLESKLCVVRERYLTEFGDDGGLFGEPGEIVAAYREFVDRVVCVGSEHLGRLMRAGRVVFEGAQGVLLDEKFGFHPYTTWSTTTFANVDKLVGEVGGGPVVRLGLVRAYTTRHGPGPMPSFDERLGGLVDEPFNSFGEWQRGFRVGHFDAVAHRYAVAACGGVDGLAITHLDSVAGQREFGMCDVWVGEDGEQTRELIYPAANDRDLQERVTAKLINTRGVVREVDSDADGWSSQISEALGGEVLCASMGPTCSDKVGSGVLA